MAPTLAQIYVPMIATLGASAVAVVGSYYVGRGMRSQEWKLMVRERLLERSASTPGSLPRRIAISCSC